MSNQPSSSHLPATFVSGSIMRHIWVMTSTAAIGLIGIFVVDLIDIIFLSMLNNEDIIAGVGFAASLSFFTMSLSIGITISMAALVSKMVGQRRIAQARRYVVNIAMLALLLTSLLMMIMWLNLPFFFGLLGASEGPLQVGIDYLQILLPSLPIMATGMAFSAALRAVGDAKLSMYCTLIGGAVNAALDPIFIFTLGLGVEGAALASVIARLVVLLIAYQGLTRKHQLLKKFVLKEFVEDLRSIFKIAGPAMITNMATPLGNAIVINTIAKFGGAYVAGYAIIGRISPVAFGLVFALSGAVAPIIGQNFGAKKFDRIKQTLRDALLFNAIYVTLVSALLYMLQGSIISLFSLEGEAADLMRVFCTWIAITFIFNGAQFVANTAFNNLGRPIYATWFNMGRATIGTLPFVIVGGQMGGAAGVLIGQAAGGFLFSVAAVIIAVNHTRNIARKAANKAAAETLPPI